MRTDWTKKTSFNNYDIKLSSFDEKFPSNFVTKQEVYKYVGDQLTGLQTFLQDAFEKLNHLQEKFAVARAGEPLNRKYQIVFNENGESHTDDDEMAKIMMNEFVKEYSLDISEALDFVVKFKEHMDFFSVSNRPSYCEVDLFDKEKPPVQC